MGSDRLKRLYTDLRNLKVLFGLGVYAYEDTRGLVLADNQRIWCLISEKGMAWEMSCNKFCGEQNKWMLLKALRQIACNDTILLGDDAVFLSIEIASDD